MQVGVVLQVTGTKGAGVITPTITADASGFKPASRPNLPGSAVTVSLIRIDASGGAAWLEVSGLPGESTPAQPAVASFEVSRKPAINLLWVGATLLVAGTAIAVTCTSR